MSTLSKLIQEAKDLNIPSENCTKTKQELEKSIKGNIIKHKEITFDVDSPICINCLNELKIQPVINERGYYQKPIDDAVRSWSGMNSRKI